MSRYIEMAPASFLSEIHSGGIPLGDIFVRFIYQYALIDTTSNGYHINWIELRTFDLLIDILQVHILVHTCTVCILVFDIFIYSYLKVLYLGLGL